jgi:hypothetical protein
MPSGGVNSKVVTEDPLKKICYYQILKEQEKESWNKKITI